MATSYRGKLMLLMCLGRPHICKWNQSLSPGSDSLKSDFHTNHWTVVLFSLQLKTFLHMMAANDNILKNSFTSQCRLIDLKQYTADKKHILHPPREPATNIEAEAGDAEALWLWLSNLSCKSVTPFKRHNNFHDHRWKFVQHFTHAAVLHKHVRNILVGIVWCTLAVSYVAWCISLSESLKSGVLWLYYICSMMSCELLSKHDRLAECCSLHMSTIVAWHWQIPNCSKNHAFKSFPNDTEGLTETINQNPDVFP